MIPLNPEAEALNNILQEHSPLIHDLLSEKGKRIFFPKKGLVRQGQDAKGKDINATIGMAIEDDTTPMRLQSIAQCMDLAPEEAFPYAPSFGIPELRQRWQQLIREKNPSINGTISLPVVTCGLTHGLSVVGFLFLDPGDRLLHRCLDAGRTGARCTGPLGSAPRRLARCALRAARIDGSGRRLRARSKPPCGALHR